jgi:DNA-binding response OmpR family regulator
VLNHDVTVIAVTAHPMTGDAERCLAAGMDDYISKPIDLKTLVKVMENWLSQTSQRVLQAPIMPTSGDDQRSTTGPRRGSLVFNREMYLSRMMGDEEFAHDAAIGFATELPKLLSTLDLDEWTLAGSLGG